MAGCRLAVESARTVDSSVCGRPSQCPTPSPTTTNTANASRMPGSVTLQITGIAAITSASAPARSSTVETSLVGFSSRAATRGEKGTDDDPGEERQEGHHTTTFAMAAGGIWSCRSK